MIDFIGKLHVGFFVAALFAWLLVFILFPIYSAYPNLFSDSGINLTDILTIFGWFAAFGFGILAQRRLIKDNTKLKVYEQLAMAFKDFQKASADAHVYFKEGLPLGVLESIGEEQKKFLELEGVVDERRLILASLEGKKKQVETIKHFIEDIENKKRALDQSYLKLFGLIDIYSSLLFKFDKALDAIRKEYDSVSKNTQTQLIYLMGLDKFSFDQWNKTEIEMKQVITSTELLIFSIYVQDFMHLLHNELAAPLLGKTKHVRSTNSKIKILTRNGLE